jgi:hypothetical protein
MGVIYRASELRPERVVALKVVLAAAEGSSDGHAAQGGALTAALAHEGQPQPATEVGPSMVTDLPGEGVVETREPGSGRLTPLVRRDREQHLLRAGLGDAAAGIRSLVLVVGEAGIGKPRLISRRSTSLDRRPVPIGTRRGQDDRCDGPPGHA